MADEKIKYYYPTPVYLSKDYLHDRDITDWEYFVIGCFSALSTKDDRQHFVSDKYIMARYFPFLKGEAKRGVRKKITEAIGGLIDKKIIVPVNYFSDKKIECCAYLTNLFPSYGKRKDGTMGQVNYVIIFEEEIEAVCKIPLEKRARSFAQLFRYFVFIMGHISNKKGEAPVATFTYDRALDLIDTSRSFISAANKKLKEAGLIAYRPLNYSATEKERKFSGKEHSDYSNVYSRAAEEKALDEYCIKKGYVYKDTSNWGEDKDDKSDKKSMPRVYANFYRALYPNGDGLYKIDGSSKHSDEFWRDAYNYIKTKNEEYDWEDDPRYRPLEQFYKYKPKSFFEKPIDISINNNQTDDVLKKTNPKEVDKEETIRVEDDDNWGKDFDDSNITPEEEKKNMDKALEDGPNECNKEISKEETKENKEDKGNHEPGDDESNDNDWSNENNDCTDDGWDDFDGLDDNSDGSWGEPKPKEPKEEFVEEADTPSIEKENKVMNTAEENNKNENLTDNNDNWDGDDLDDDKIWEGIPDDDDDFEEPFEGLDEEDNDKEQKQVKEADIQSEATIPFQKEVTISDIERAEKVDNNIARREKEIAEYEAEFADWDDEEDEDWSEFSYAKNSANSNENKEKESLFGGDDPDPYWKEIEDGVQRQKQRDKKRKHREAEPGYESGQSSKFKLK